MNPDVKKYLQEILRDAGQTNLGQDLENQMLQDLYTRLEDRLALLALNNLSPSQREELEKLSGQKSQPAIETFLKTNIKNYDQLFAQNLLDFRNLYIEAGKK